MRGYVILRHALTGSVHEPKTALGAGVVLLGGQAVPPDGFSGVLRHALTGVVPESETVLAGGVALLGSQASTSACG